MGKSATANRSGRGPVAWLLGAALAWSLWAFGVEAVRTFFPPPPAPDLALRPALWQLRSAPAEELAAFLGDIDRRLPPDRRIAVATRPLPGPQGFFLYLWAVYDLPHHDVVRASHRWNLAEADDLLTWHTTLESLTAGPPVPGLDWDLERALARQPERVAEHPAGALYRLAPP